MSNALLEEAKSVSLGMANAKLNERPGDAALLFESYLNDAVEKGHARDTAWAVLASASTNWFVESLKTRGREQHRSPASLLKEIAHNHVGAVRE